MLGAQARAAELAAASAAKQRQVSRDLEDRQLPPNPAVSLSAFTKPPPASRNKGNKNWKPLVLDDIDEDTTPERLTSKEASDKKIPTAPRAMVAGRSLSTVVAQPQPKESPHGPFPYPAFPQNMYLHQSMFLGGMPTYGSMMVPDDMSPTKQEQKLSMLENIPFPHDQEFPQDPFNQEFAQQYIWNDPYYSGYQMPYQVQHMDDSYFSQQSNPQGEATDQQPSYKAKEPYDTERAMKECVNDLKEKAKDGKTVLHNPNSQKELVPRSAVRKASGSRPPLVPWDVRPKESVQNSEWEVMPPPEPPVFTEKDLSNLKPPPGLPVPSNLAQAVSLEPTDCAPKVGSIEWMTLAPITSAERDRVRRRMALAAKSVTNEVPQDHIEQEKEDIAETQKWFHTDARGERLLRRQVDLSAQLHASKVMSNIKARNGGELPEQFQDGKDDGLAATLILGNVACNLQTYLVGDRKSVEQRKNFHKVKAVPDWCTERGGLAVGGVGGGDSYFDGAAGGFYGAPVRVARDPRFRPQVKEGIKVKPEEEWKHRHEMYGRRMM